MGLTPRRCGDATWWTRQDFNLANRKGASTVAACQLCAGVTATAALKVLLRRGNVMSAPYNHHFDAYNGRLSVSKLPFGNAGLGQQVKLAIVRRLLSKFPVQREAPNQTPTARTPLEEILNLARWAPSGDNGQPWRLRLSIQGPFACISGHDPLNIYEYRDCEPTWLAAGMLLETMRIAASGWQRTMEWQGPEPGADTILVHFSLNDTICREPLFSFLTVRSVQPGRLSSSRPDEHGNCLDSCP